MHDDDIWDEHMWESFLKENDERINRFMDLVFSFVGRNPPPEFRDVRGQKRWKQDLRQYMRDQGWENDEIDATIPIQFHFDGKGPIDDQLASLHQMDDLDVDENGPLQSLPIYEMVQNLANLVLEWANALPVNVKDSVLVQFCNQIMLLPSNVAKGHGIGYEKETIGGNIACVKRALEAANISLSLLSEMKTGEYMSDEIFRELAENAYETRNALGLHVQSLRNQFNLGID
ncbi:MAG: hypothetical protein HKN43_08120 [Rhodothermales bacterium]|nr:hypothetical protein [Rhodothermales bacterium]